MAYVKKQKLHSHCLKCGSAIPENKRSDAKYCSERCKDAEEKLRYCRRNPDYVKRQRRLVSEIKHMREHGHLRFLDDPMQNKRDKFRAARSLGYRSMLEVDVARQLESLGVDYKYEKLKIKYIVNESRTYTPDLVLPNGIVVETKGRFTTEDRKKHLLVKEQHPEYDIRFVFSNSRQKIRKGSKTTYGQWCEKHGFLYADKQIPDDWLKE